MDVTLFGPSLVSQVVLWAEEVQALGAPRVTRVRAVLAQEVELAKIVGASGMLEFVDGGSRRRVRGIFNEVTLLATAASEARVLPTYELTLVSAVALLAGSFDCRIFQDKTTQQIVGQLLLEFGVAENQQDWNLSTALTPRVYSVQYRESALAYASRLLEEEGIYYVCSSEEDGTERIAFRDDSSASAALPDRAVPLRRSTGLVDDEGRSVYSLGFGVAATFNKISVNAFDFEKPSLALESTFGEGSDLESYTVREVFTTPERGVQLAELRCQAAVAAATKVTFSTNVVETEAGRRFDVARSAEETSAYFVTRVVHEYSHDPDHSSEGAVHGHHATVEALPLELKFRPLPSHPAPRIVGPQTALVTGAAGAEPETVCTDPYGRVKVHFHWDRRGPLDDGSSCWMRVAQLQTSGSVILPRVGWEVVVEFVDGDPDRPVVTGRLFNGQFGPPYQLPEGKTRTSLQSASSPSGGGRNEIRFEDAAGSEEMMINSQYNTQIAAANNRKKNVTKNETLVIGNNAHLSVGADQTLQVTGGYEATVTGNQTTTVSGNRKSETNAVYGLTVKGSSNSSVSGNWMSMVGSPLDALIALGVSKAADLASAQADKVFRAVSAQAQGAIDQVTGALDGLTAQTDAISASMAEVADGKMAASAGVLGGAVALPGASDVLRSLGQGPAMGRAAEGTESSSGGIALGAMLRSGATAKLQEIQKSARAAVGDAAGVSGDAAAVASEANAAGPAGALGGFSAADAATGPGYSQTKVASSHDENIEGSRLQVTLEPVQVTVKTTLSETVGAAHLEVIAGDRAESVEGASSEAEPGLVVVAQGDENLTVHGACQISVGGAVQETVKGDYSIESGVGLSLIGSLHDVKAKGKITFKCGASSIVVDSSGVTITSAAVSVSGSGITVTGSVSDG